MNQITPMLKVLRYLSFLGFTFLCVLARAQGGPPLITDDPGTPGNKHWEINIAYTNSQFGYGRVYEVPHLDLNYGYGKNVQFKLEGPLTIFSGSGESYAALGYTDWGVKWRFQEEDKKNPALSIYPQVLFVANSGFAQLGVVDPGTDLLLPLEALKSFGRFQIDGEVGLLLRQFTGTQLDAGVCAEFDLTKRLALLGEIHDVTSSAFVQDQLVWNLGFRYNLSSQHSLLFSSGRGFGSAGADNPKFLIYVGLQIRA